MKNNRVVVEDGDVLSVFVKVPISSWDPAGEIPAVVRTYRVVANASGPILELVPLQKEPVRVNEKEFEKLREL